MAPVTEEFDMTFNMHGVTSFGNIYYRRFGPEAMAWYRWTNHEAITRQYKFIRKSSAYMPDARAADTIHDGWNITDPVGLSTAVYAALAETLAL